VEAEAEATVVTRRRPPTARAGHGTIVFYQTAISFCRLSLEDSPPFHFRYWINCDDGRPYLPSGTLFLTCSLFFFFFSRLMPWPVDLSLNQNIQFPSPIHSRDVRRCDGQGCTTRELEMLLRKRRPQFSLLRVSRARPSLVANKLPLTL
jgi:hypothetical protein